MIGLFLSAVAVFWSSVPLDFVQWDDNINIYNNPHLRELNGDSLWWMFSDTSYARRYLPLAWLSWAVQYQVNGLDPMGYHLGNVLLHAMNTVLVFLLLRQFSRIFGDARTRQLPGYETATLVGAGLGALIWAVHPLRVEPVVWASGRVYCQAGFFLFLSLWSYLKYKSLKPGEGGHRIFYGVALAAWACSLLTYPIGLGMVLLLFLLDPFTGDNAKAARTWWERLKSKSIWMEKLPFVGVALLVLSVTVWSRFASGLHERPVSLEEFGWGSRFMQAVYVWAYYVWKPWLPMDLSPVYSTLISFNPWSGVFWASLGLVAGVSFWVWKHRQQWPGAMVLWVTYLALLVPLLGLTEHPHFTSDRYDYVVGFGWAILLATGVTRLWLIDQGRLARVAGFSLGAVALLLGLSSVRQTAIWADSAGLHIHMIERLGDSPHRHKLYQVLGNIYIDRGEVESAALCFREVIAIRPSEADAHSNLADLLADAGRLTEAREHYEQALQWKPNHLNARQNLGVALARSGLLEEAVEQFLTLLRFHPGHERAHLNLGLTLAKLGRDKEANWHRDEVARLVALKKGEPNER